MRLLLDTHVFLWIHTEPERLGEHLPDVENPETELIVSSVVAWEIAIKYGLGRLLLPAPPDRYVPDRMRRIDAMPLPVEHEHALAVAALPLLHRDPFDRLLIAQAQLLDLPILTSDADVAQYAVRTRIV